jgi:LPXTG-motif cell wall-anchored protein
VDAQHSSWRVYIAPAILFGILVVVSGALLLARRRRRVVTTWTDGQPSDA